MAEFLRTKTTAVSAALLGGILLASCANGSNSTNETTETMPSTIPSTPAVQANCNPTDNWMSVPENMNLSYVAEALSNGVTTDEVQRGSEGSAYCNPGLSANAINEGGSQAWVSVAGVGSLCLAIGIHSQEVPQPDIAYQDLMAVCPAIPKGA